jgi:basic membrane protein A
MDENNAELMTEDIRTAVEEAKEKIIAGEITVHDYEADGACPY